MNGVDAYPGNSGERSTVSETAWALMRSMIRIRRVEERLARLFADGEVPGFIHLSIGQEAIAAAFGACLTDADTVASTHRGHGHCLAKGVPVSALVAEVMGRDSGACRGRGGSMHVADLARGMLGANGIVGAGAPIALGSALAHKVSGRRAVAVAFFGDGAMAEGAVYETMNLAALWQVPLVMVCERNGWSEFSPSDRAFAGDGAKLAEAFGLPFLALDGDDVLAVHAAVDPLVSACREDRRPRLVSCATHRVAGHFEGDPQRYRDAPERAAAAAADPIMRLAARLCVDEDRDARARFDTIEAEITAEIDAAVEAARLAPDPDFDLARGDVYG